MDVSVVGVTVTDIVRIKVADNTATVKTRWEGLREDTLEKWEESFNKRYGDLTSRIVARIGYDFGKITREWLVLYEPVVFKGGEGRYAYVYRLVSLTYIKSYEQVMLSAEAYGKLRVIGVYEEEGVETMYDHIERIVGEAPDYIFGA